MVSVVTAAHVDAGYFRKTLGVHEELVDVTVAVARIAPIAVCCSGANPVGA